MRFRVQRDMKSDQDGSRQVSYTQTSKATGNVGTNEYLSGKLLLEKTRRLLGSSKPKRHDTIEPLGHASVAGDIPDYGPQQLHWNPTREQHRGFVRRLRNMVYGIRIGEPYPITRDTGSIELQPITPSVPGGDRPSTRGAASRQGVSVDVPPCVTSPREEATKPFKKEYSGPPSTPTMSGRDQPSSRGDASRRDAPVNMAQQTRSYGEEATWFKGKKGGSSAPFRSGFGYYANPHSGALGEASMGDML